MFELHLTTRYAHVADRVTVVVHCDSCHADRRNSNRESCFQMNAAASAFLCNITHRHHVAVVCCAETSARTNHSKVSDQKVLSGPGNQTLII